MATCKRDLCCLAQLGPDRVGCPTALGHTIGSRWVSESARARVNISAAAALVVQYGARGGEGFTGTTNSLVDARRTSGAQAAAAASRIEIQSPLAQLQFALVPAQFDRWLLGQLPPRRRPGDTTRDQTAHWFGCVRLSKWHDA